MKIHCWSIHSIIHLSCILGPKNSAYLARNFNVYVVYSMAHTVCAIRHEHTVWSMLYSPFSMNLKRLIQKFYTFEYFTTFV